MSHEDYMQIALAEARKAEIQGEVPVGAVVVVDGKIIAQAHNERESRGNPLAHAEIIALNSAALKLGTWRLDSSILYVTLEPCPMCAGAALQARVPLIVYGTRDPRAGCCGSLYNIPEDKRFPFKCRVVGGVLASECAKVLGGFFLARRKAGNH